MKIRHGEHEVRANSDKDHPGHKRMRVSGGVKVPTMSCVIQHCSKEPTQYFQHQQSQASCLKTKPSLNNAAWLWMGVGSPCESRELGPNGRSCWGSQRVFPSSRHRPEPFHRHLRSEGFGASGSDPFRSRTSSQTCRRNLAAALQHSSIAASFLFLKFEVALSTAC